MEKKVMMKMNTRLAVAAAVLLFGLLLLAGQEAAAADDGYAPATDAAEETTTTSGGGRASYGQSTKAECEVPGTCDVKAVDPTRPGALANKHTRGCSKIFGCRG